MNEEEWLKCTIPGSLLVYLASRTTERKLRLFACGCARRASILLSDERYRKAIDAAERFADARTNADRQGLKIARKGAMDVERAENHSAPMRVARAVAGRSGLEAAQRGSHYVSYAISRGAGDKLHAEWEAQVELLRCVFGNPFRNVCIVPTWIMWNDRTVLRIAETIYHEKDFGRLPILADALEDAGCDNADILAHCRGPGPHVRGCWVVDLLLGKQ